MKRAAARLVRPARPAQQGELAGTGLPLDRPAIRAEHPEGGGASQREGGDHPAVVGRVGVAGDAPGAGR